MYKKLLGGTKSHTVLQTFGLENLVETTCLSSIGFEQRAFNGL
jgi:hypothetical protein